MSMVKTTIYLPEALKRAVEHAARTEGTSEAEVIREALARYVGSHQRRPTLPLFRSSDPHLAERVDEALSGFGE